MTPDTVRRVVRVSAFYDLVLTAGFATPWTAPFALETLTGIHRTLGLNGVLPVVDDPFSMLFVNLFGSIVVVWSLVRLIRPTPFLGAGDTVGRILFSSWFAWALAGGASPVVVGFLVLEIGWGLVQGATVWRPVTVGWLQHRRRTLPAC